VRRPEARDLAAQLVEQPRAAVDGAMAVQARCGAKGRMVRQGRKGQREATSVSKPNDGLMAACNAG